jgi:PilZ domain
MSGQQLTNTKRWLRKRRSQRIELNVPIVVHRPVKEGPQFSERTHTLDVSAHGALMALAGMVAPKQRLLVQNINSGEQQECRVVYVEKDLLGPTKVAVEFTRPSPSFWRIAYPPADWTTSV